MSDKRLRCPFCEGEVKIVVCDDEGNLHPDKYENDPWSGLGFRLYHDVTMTNGQYCPIAGHESEGTLGMYIYDTREEAIEKWNTRKPMERIVERLENELELADKEKERNARENPLQFDSVKGYATGIYNAIEIVKGVERMSDCRVTKEEAIELLKAYVGNEYYTEKWQETCRMAIDALNGQAEPVRHGEWLPTRDSNKKECSNCGVIHLIAQYPHGQANYCPNCGAKMKAGGQNE